MEFGLDSDEQLLADTAARFSTEQFGPSVARAVAAGDASTDGTWADMVDLGWTGILVGEHLGGAGATLFQGCLIAEALARSLAPVPFVGSALIGACAVRHLAAADVRDDLLGRIAAGERFSILLDERLGWPPRGEGGLAWEWSEGSRLLGPVPGGVAEIGAAGVSALGTNQDLVRPLGQVEGVVPVALEDSPATRLFLAQANVVTCAALVGLMSGALDLAVEYATNRVQFGQAIGSFQAVQHMCSEMLVDTESSRSAAWGAAWEVENLDVDDACRSAAIAKAWCAGAAIRVCETAIQVHGGMGITWDCDAHLYLRDAHLLARAFWDGEAARAALATALLV